MKRLFLPAAARAQLLEQGMATVRSQIKPGYWLTSGILHSSLSAVMINGGAQFEKPHGRLITWITCPTPPGAEYWVPEPWQNCTSTDFYPAHPWRSPAEMPKQYARLFVRIAAVRVVRDGDTWMWEMDVERIEK